MFTSQDQDANAKMTQSLAEKLLFFMRSNKLSLAILFAPALVACFCAFIYRIKETLDKIKEEQRQVLIREMTAQEDNKAKNSRGNRRKQREIISPPVSSSSASNVEIAKHDDNDEGHAQTSDAKADAGSPSLSPSPPGSFLPTPKKQEQKESLQLSKDQVTDDNTPDRGKTLKTNHEVAKSTPMLNTSTSNTFAAPIVTEQSIITVEKAITVEELEWSRVPTKQEERIQTLKSRVASLETSLLRYKEECATLKQEKASLQTSQATLYKNIQSLTAANRAAEESVKEMRMKTQHALSRVDALKEIEAQLKQALDENAILNVTKTQLEDYIKTLQEQLTQTEGEFEGLKGRHLILVEQHNSLELSMQKQVERAENTLEQALAHAKAEASVHLDKVLLEERAKQKSLRGDLDQIKQRIVDQDAELKVSREECTQLTVKLKEACESKREEKEAKEILNFECANQSFNVDALKAERDILVQKVDAKTKECAEIISQLSLVKKESEDWEKKCTVMLRNTVNVNKNLIKLGMKDLVHLIKEDLDDGIFTPCVGMKTPIQEKETVPSQQDIDSQSSPLLTPAKSSEFDKGIEVAASENNQNDRFDDDSCSYEDKNEQESTQPPATPTKMVSAASVSEEQPPLSIERANQDKSLNLDELLLVDEESVQS